ncbi:MAG: SMP-30/gluconolactonase/LRE family protein [Chloroflexota bacterium]|nr:SMP-30/gluconolactonase/LRE family protein [Chloroflexota bacterium]
MSWQFILVNGPYGGIAEGPAWDGSALLFTHIPASRIIRYDPQDRGSSVYRSDTNNANGLMFDPQGRLYACEGGARRVVRYEADGSATVLADGYEGKRLNVPNDLAIDPNGSVWFTDPFYEGAGGEWSNDRSNKDLDHDSVYRLDEQDDGSWSITRVTFDTTRPNGLLFSLDYKTLYVAQSGRNADEKRELRAYPVNDDGSLGDHTVLHDFGAHRGIDGMVLDTEGNIVATAGFDESGPGPMIYVFAPDGEVIETHPTPTDRPTNCSFGGSDLTTLFVTTGGGDVYMAHTDRQGRLHYPSV